MGKNSQSPQSKGSSWGQRFNSPLPRSAFPSSRIRWSGNEALRGTGALILSGCCCTWSLRKEKPLFHGDGDILPCDLSRAVQKETVSSVFRGTTWTSRSWHSISCYSSPEPPKQGHFNRMAEERVQLFLSEQQKAVKGWNQCSNHIPSDSDRPVRPNSPTQCRNVP